MTEHLSRVAEVLIEHTRVSIERCHCGWSDLGQSHAEHVARALVRHRRGHVRLARARRVAELPPAHRPRHRLPLTTHLGPGLTPRSTPTPTKENNMTSTDQPYDQMSDLDPERPRYPEVEVQLSEMDGNGFVIIGRTRTALRRHGVPNEEIEEFQSEAISGDYDRLLQTVMAWVRTS